ncbi:hypothetical protein H2201_008884 [Coniosporium apollinis]|uniref:TIR domain-containing protein n=1 Tax=Coniosporium apollinis TaxID=61459 RepID=A0ABQ9NIA8_9PEZI|nr:hypothetical protein H2201_008884 [Coniosporium apollinis]
MDANEEIPLTDLSNAQEAKEIHLDEPLIDINHHFDGGFHGLFFGPKFRNPTFSVKQQRHPPLDLEKGLYNRDILRRITWKPEDLERRIDPLEGKLCHFTVQASPDAYKEHQGPWRRTQIEDNASKRLRLAGWILGRRSFETGSGLDGGQLAARAGRILLASIPLLFMSLGSFPISDSFSEFYHGVPARSWEYPKHVRNILDASPAAPREVPGWDHGTKRFDAYDVTRQQERLLRPRELVVKQNGAWVNVVQGKRKEHVPYLFISYSNVHFYTNSSQEKRAQIEEIAQLLTERHNLTAYWLDFRCRAQQQPELTDDIHRIADVIRGAQDVWVILPTYDRVTISQWGSRLWTLPEALLAPRHRISIYAIADNKKRERFRELSLLDLPLWAWVPYTGSPFSGENLVEDTTASVEDLRLLAEQFSGMLSLSQLELISVALRALRSRKWTEYQKGDPAYALMALLQYRPAMDPSDSEFQALARLSLANDSDRIVERMVCFLPKAGQEGLFTTEDALHAKLHDIEPIAQVAGVCKDDALMLDGCHGITIHWGNFPYIGRVTRVTWKKKLSRLTLRAGAFCWFLGITMASIPAVVGAGIFFIIVALLATWASPWLVANIFGGKVWSMERWLIGFEGSMPIEDIERRMFGNYIGRLSYAASSSVYCRRDAKERIGVRPHENLPLPEGHSLFTLVDTGSKTVTLFSAKRPPSVALICGKEGGMLRALLCAYDQPSMAYVRQSVIRMETPTLTQAGMMGWVKVK